MIAQEAGSHFDPRVVEAFNAIDDTTFVQIGRDVW
jgi:response regulator RpfG family c-di-GMP phosphodiesterase